MKFIIIITLSLFSFTIVCSQESYVDSVLNEEMYYDESDVFYMEFDSNKTFHFMYANGSYNNKSFYAGREVMNPQYFLSGQVSYFNSKGFFMGLATSSGTWFSTNNDANYNNSLTLGYGKALKKHKWFRYNASYSRYFSFNNGFDFSSTYSNNLHLGVGAKHKWFGTRVGLNYLFGEASKATFSWDIYSSITLLKMSTFNNIKVEPEVSFFYDSELVEQINTDNSLSYTNEFGWMNTELTLPLQININDFDIELGYTINLPRSLDPNYTYNTTSFFSLSIGYIFEL
ncbi:hypothetical protein [Carboxylicivirga sp. N1Y90]|uniref:hypothetical protein n=1 Tax=Carboxylicivirga fragile TaxID=3417571 RepID=UPI003D336C11|nr:hypothetical protein [Marinilabiliaceae bacterium N1Y90]